MIWFYNQVLFRPLYNILVFIYNLIPGGDFGLAVIALTIIIRFIFVPLSIKALISQKELAKLQPKIKELNEKHKNDKKLLGQETMALYKAHNINPFSGCLPLLIQFPVLLALYKALGSGFKPENLNLLYSFVHNPGHINEIAFQFLDMAKRNISLAVIAGALQWFQLRQASRFQAPASKNEPESAAFKMNQQMLYFFPVMVIIIAWNLPAGLVLYWIASTGFSIFEQLYINKKYNPKTN